MSLVLPMQDAAPPAADAGLTAACGEAPGTICEAVWNATENEALAKAADWFIGRPLTALLILLVALILTRIARRAVRKAVSRLIATNTEVATKALTKVGMTQTAAAIDEPRRHARAESIATVFASTITVLIWVIAVLLVLGELGINLGPLIAGAGIAGVALGFGAQNLVRDCVAGLFMLIEDQYGLGDAVDLGVATGAVERISLRATVLRGQDGTVWHVPNGEIRRVGNRSKLWSVAVLDITVAYHADLEATRRVIHQVAATVVESEDFAGSVLSAPEILGLESISPENVTFRLLVKTEPGAQFRLQRALREAMKYGLDDAHIDVAPAPAAE